MQTPVRVPIQVQRQNTVCTVIVTMDESGLCVNKRQRDKIFTLLVDRTVIHFFFFFLRFELRLQQRLWIKTFWFCICLNENERKKIDVDSF